MKHAREDYNDLTALDKRIPADEPVFLFRGQDKFAVRAVLYYADTLAAAGADPEMIASVRAQADKMQAWELKKTPDINPPAEGVGVNEQQN